MEQCNTIQTVLIGRLPYLLVGSIHPMAVFRLPDAVVGLSATDNFIYNRITFAFSNKKFYMLLY